MGLEELINHFLENVSFCFKTKVLTKKGKRTQVISCFLLRLTISGTIISSIISIYHTAYQFPRVLTMCDAFLVINLT